MTIYCLGSGLILLVSVLLTIQELRSPKTHRFTLIADYLIC